MCASPSDFFVQQQWIRRIEFQFKRHAPRALCNEINRIIRHTKLKFKILY